MQLNNFLDLSLGNLTISLASSLFVVWAGVKYFTKKRLDLEFNKLLEDHKADLQQIRDYNNFDLGRRMQDFNLYTTKRHEVYPELLSLFLAAGQELGEFRDVRKEYPLIHMEGSHLLHLLKNRFNIPEEFCRNIIDQWEQDKSTIIDEVYKTIEMFEWTNMKNAIINAYNKTLLYELYLSDQVAENFLELSKAMFQYSENLNSHLMEDNSDRELTNTMNDLKRKIESLLAIQKNTMRKELGIAYYKD